LSDNIRPRGGVWTEEMDKQKFVKPSVSLLWKSANEVYKSGQNAANQTDIKNLMEAMRLYTSAIDTLSYRRGENTALLVNRKEGSAPRLRKLGRLISQAVLDQMDTLNEEERGRVRLDVKDNAQKVLSTLLVNRTIASAKLREKGVRGGEGIAQHLDVGMPVLDNFLALDLDEKNEKAGIKLAAALRELGMNREAKARINAVGVCIYVWVGIEAASVYL
jgi:hypothetical protein